MPEFDPDDHKVWSTSNYKIDLRKNQAERKSGKFPPSSWLGPRLDLNKPGDFYCYQLFRFAVIANIILISSILLDTYLATNFIVRKSDLEQNPTLLFYQYSHIIKFVYSFLIILFYLAYRLKYHLKTNSVPCLFDTKSLSVYGRGQWIRRLIFIKVAALVVIYKPEFSLKYFAIQLGLKDSLPGVFVIQALLSFSQALCAAILHSAMLMLEKSVRFFPVVQAEVRALNERLTETPQQKGL